MKGFCILMRIKPVAMKVALLGLSAPVYFASKLVSRG